MSNISLYVLFFSISLIHSSFLNYFGFDYNSLVNGSFEFTKVIFFNIISSLTIILFLFEQFFNKESIKIPYKKILLFITSISILSTIFSISPFISLFGNQEKAHSMILVLNLISIFIVLVNKKKEVLNNILKIYLLSIIIVCFIGIKEFYFPSLGYQGKLNNAVSSFGNNQFFALSIILLIPLFLKKYQFKYTYLLLIFLSFCLLVTKSFIGITIFFVYLLFYLFGKKKGFLISFLFIFLSSIIIFLYFPEKLHSLLSRFYIWQNVISLYLFNIKNIIFGYGFETLDLMFSKEKNPYLYIFENYGFIADRSHNLWLDILYSTGIFGFILAIYTSYQILKQTKNTYYFDIFLIFFIFCFFNFAGVSHYLFLLLILSIFMKKDGIDTDLSKFKTNYLFFIPTIFCLFSIIYSTRFYIAEMYYKSGYIEKAINNYSYPEYYFEILNFDEGLKYYSFPPLIYYQKMILTNPYNNLINNCETLVSNYTIAENYLWCGNLLEDKNYKKESLDFYKRGLSKLPNLWDENSIYYNNFFVKHTISGNRFLSEKYGNLRQIIELTK